MWIFFCVGEVFWQWLPFHLPFLSLSISPASSSFPSFFFPFALFLLLLLLLTLSAASIDFPASLQLSELGVVNVPGMPPAVLNIAAEAVVVDSTGQSVPVWAGGQPATFPVTLVCGMLPALKPLLCSGSVGGAGGGGEGWQQSL